MNDWIAILYITSYFYLNCSYYAYRKYQLWWVTLCTFCEYFNFVYFYYGFWFFVLFICASFVYDHQFAIISIFLSPICYYTQLKMDSTLIIIPLILLYVNMFKLVTIYFKFWYKFILYLQVRYFIFHHSFDYWKHVVARQSIWNMRYQIRMCVSFKFTTTPSAVPNFQSFGNVFEVATTRIEIILYKASGKNHKIELTCHLHKWTLYNLQMCMLRLIMNGSYIFIRNFKERSRIQYHVRRVVVITIVNLEFFKNYNIVPVQLGLIQSMK